MAHDIAIDPATPDDLPRIAALIRALAEYERLSHLCVASEDDLHAALFAERPAAEVRLARLGHQTVGFALFFQTFSTFLGRPGLWLEDLFVDPPFRGRGIGRALLLALATIARERRCGRFEWAVLDWNVDAVRFYESLGATILPDWRIVRVVGPALDRLGARTIAER